jgi:hypothetical protein
VDSLRMKPMQWVICSLFESCVFSVSGGLPVAPGQKIWAMEQQLGALQYAGNPDGLE